MDDKKCLSMNDLHFSYTPNEEILKGMTLEIDERSTAIIGQNGAGKTTFVKLLKGLLRPTSGTIQFEGKDLSEFTVAQIARHIGMVFQNPNDQIFKNKVIDEIMFGPLKIGMSEQEAMDSANEAMEMLGLTELKDENPYDLGLSTRKLVAIASILAMKTQVIILDEPTIAQDYAGKEKIKEVIRRLRQQNRTVITIIHDMDFVADTFERAIVFANGKVILDGTTREVFAQKEVLEQAYLEQPNVTKLCYGLGYDKVFLTTDEFIQEAQKQIER